MTLVLEGSAGIAVCVGVARIYCKACFEGLFGLKTLRQAPKKQWTFKEEDSQEREEFEELIGFLAAVPLFQRQLPKHELPKVARAFRKQKWTPGAKVVEQGHEGKAFYIVQSGEAKVVVTDDKGVDNVRAVLYHRDYFGGHTLTAKRPNVATIVAAGTQNLVTLSMSRQAFESLGLHKTFVFPARPAFYEGQKIDDGKRTNRALELSHPGTPRIAERRHLHEEEVAFIAKAVLQNSHLRARNTIEESAAKEIAQSALVLPVLKGVELLRAGNPTQEYMYVVSKGSFDVVIRHNKSMHESLEAFLVQSEMSDVIGRKDQFLISMAAKGFQSPKKRSLNECRHASLEPMRQTEDDKQGKSLQQGRGMGRSSATCQRSGLMSLLDFDLMSNECEEPCFRVGAKVAYIMAAVTGLVKLTGVVVELVSQGAALCQVCVEFPEPHGKKFVKPHMLRPVEEESPVVVLKPGDSFGELALLYRTRQPLTVVAHEDSVVFCIPKASLLQHFGREREKKLVDRYWTLLSEVHMLSHLLLAEQLEIAKNARGYATWQPGEKVLVEGETLPEQLWYVIHSGSAIVARSGGPEVTLLRKGHFGDKAIIGNSTESDVSVTAGSAGLTCLVFPGEILRGFDFPLDGKGNLLEHERPWAKHTAVVRDVPVSVDDLQITGVLGKGGFGSVFLAKHDDKEYALKRLSKGYIVNQHMTKQLCIERDILSMVNSRFINKFYRSYQDDQHVYMLLELATGGHLYKIISRMPAVLYPKNKPMGSIPMFYIACVVCALEHLHERHIAYRDLKPENILLDSRGYAKICDLGFAIFMLGRSNTIVGTPQYMAPEMIDAPHSHNAAVDWWALGVLAFELLALQVPWEDEDAQSPMAALFAIRRGQEQGIPLHMLPRWADLVARDFIRNLLCMDDQLRLKQGLMAKRHPWFTYNKFDFNALMAGKMPGPWSQHSKVLVETYDQPKSMADIPVERELFEEYQENAADDSDWDIDF